MPTPVLASSTSGHLRSDVHPDHVPASDDHCQELPPERTHALFAVMKGSPDPQRRRGARDELIRMHLPFATFMARRFRSRGEPLEDLVQVATIGLIKAIDGFDLGRGSSFASYAVPTMLGELRRHFRDTGWSVRVPRRLQELRVEISRATDELTQRLGRVPSAADIAAELGRGESEIRDGMRSANAYSALSLQVSAGEEGQTVLADLMGEEDESFDAVENRVVLAPLVRSLPERERRILALRFSGNRTQSEIAAEMGISQMHVSRLLTRSLHALRSQLLLAG